MSPPVRDAPTLDTQEDADRRGLFYEPIPPGGYAWQRPETYGADGWRAPLRPPTTPRAVHHSRSHRQTAPATAPAPASTPSPWERPGAWDTIVIAGVLFLGLVLVEGETASGIEVKKHKGRNGGKVTDHGSPLAELTLTFRTWDAETWASWQQVFRAIDPQRPTEQRAPVDVAHPALADRNIHRIYVKSVSLPKRDGNEWHFTAKVIQWMPPSPDARGRSVTRSPAAPRQTVFTGYGDNQAAVDAWAASQGITGDGSAQGFHAADETAFSGLGAFDTPADPADTDAEP